MSDLGRKNDGKENSQSIFTKETFGVVLLLFASLCLICLITRDALFSVPGKFVNAFLFGCFGFFAFFVIAGLIILGVMMIADKKSKLSGKNKLLMTAAFFTIAVISHIISMRGQVLPYGDYLAASYAMGEGGIATTSGGGLCIALVSYFFSTLLTDVGSYVVLGVLLAIIVYAMVFGYVKAPKNQSDKSPKFNTSYVGQQPTVEEFGGVQISGIKEYPVPNVEIPVSKPAQKLFINNPADFAVKTKREINKGESAAIKLGFSDGGLGVGNSGQSYTKAYGEELKKKIDYIKTPATIDVEKTISKDYGKPISSVTSRGDSTTTVSNYVGVREQKPEPMQNELPFFEHEGEAVGGTAGSHAASFSDRYAEIEEVESVPASVEPQEIFRELVADESKEKENPANEAQVEREIPFIEEFDKESETEQEEIVQAEDTRPQEEPPKSSIVGNARTRNIFFGDEQTSKASEAAAEKPGFTSRAAADNNLGATRRGFDFVSPEPSQPTEEKKEKPKPPINRIYNRPPLDLLETNTRSASDSGENHAERMEIIQKTLEEFHINAIPQSYIQGPSVTRYEIMMPAGISVKRVLSYDDDLKMRLASRNGVRIEAPIPGKNLVGIEVANKIPIPVGLKEVLEGMAGQKSKPGSLIFAIGKDIVGQSKSDNLAKGPHYLVAGATGSGKSVCLNVMIVSLIMRYSPEELRLILIDPKRVGFRNYEHIPHLMIDEIITEPKKSIAVLQWAYNEMERRYDEFAKCDGVISDIDGYNAEIASDTVPKMPRIVIIVDELADLMETCKKDMEARIRALAQKSRAAGIHLVLATQRPSVDIVTGTIKANLPSRIALKVMNFQDSQTILSEAGAEKLLGNGDMLYKNSGMAECERYQGAYISDREINNVVTYIKEHNQAYFDDELQEFLDNETKPKQEEPLESGGDGDDGNEISDLFLKALWLAVNTETVSISQLQRRFQIGYARAGGLVDKMERMGFVSGNEGSKARRVLITKEEFENRFGPMNDAY